MAWDYTNDYSSTILAYLSGAGTITVVSAAGLPASGKYFILKVDSEYFLCTSYTGFVLTVTGGQAGSTPANHSLGVAITGCWIVSSVLDGIRADQSQIGTYASLPTSGMKKGDQYKCTDTRYKFIYDGSIWQPFYDGLNVTTPPAASTLASSMNAGSITLTDEYNGISVITNGTGSSNENWGFCGKAYPSSSFTFTVGIQVEFFVPTVWAYFGIGMTDGLTAGSSKGIILGGFLGATGGNIGFQLGASTYNNTGSYNGNYGGQIVISAPPATSGLFFLRFVDDLSSTRRMQFSHDMVHWDEFPGAQGGVSRTDFLTPAYLGIICGQSTNSLSASYPRYRFKIFHWAGF